MVTGDDVIQILETLGGWRIGTWIDGGWGIDALLGEQIRAHQDLDLVIHRDTCGSAQDAVAALGFEHATQAEPGLPARLVLRDPSDRQVDFHPVVVDADGSGWQEIPGGTWCHYPADGLRGRQVRCLTAEPQIQHHLNYNPTARDHLDMRRLADRFRLTASALPRPNCRRRGQRPASVSRPNEPPATSLPQLGRRSASPFDQSEPHSSSWAGVAAAATLRQCSTRLRSRHECV